MANKNIVKYRIFPISIVVLVTGIILACVDVEMDDNPASFFSPEITHNTKYSLFFLSYHVLYKAQSKPDYGYDFNFKYSYITDFNNINVADWAGYFHNQVNNKDLKYILFKASLGEIDTLIFSIKKLGYPIGNSLKNNSVLKVTDSRSAVDFLYYMGFAKRCEKYVTYEREEWYDPKEKDPNDLRDDNEGISALVDGGLKQLPNAKSDFVKQRYAFQVLRLYYMGKDYDKCIQFYNDQKSLFESNSASIKYRSKGYLAGAYYAEKKYGNANYLYSLIYDQYDTMKTTAYFSFHPQEDKDWQQTLAMAKNNREKEVLWQMFGTYADPFRALKEVYSLDPKSDLLDLLLARTVNVEEEKYIYQPGEFPGVSEPGNSLNAAQLNAEAINSDLVSFLKSVADKKNTAKPYEWELAAGYLSWAKGEQGFQKYLDMAKSETKGDSLVAEHVRLIDLLDKVRNGKAGDKSFEESVVPELKWLWKGKHPSYFREGNADDVINAILIQKYTSVGDTIKAICLKGELEHYAFYNEALLNGIIAAMYKKNKSAFEEYVLSRFTFSKADILELEAVKRLYNYNFKEALAILDKDDNAGNEIVFGDPFLIHIKDCHDCDNNALTNRKPNPDADTNEPIVVTKRAFIQSMIKLEDSVKKYPAQAAKIYFLLANGYYNMSYFGNNRAFCQTKLTYAYNDYWEIHEYNREIAKDMPNYLNTTKAEEYYNKAMNASKDAEFKAKCCFMAAKCEQNEFFKTKPKDYKGDFKAGTYFGMLKSTYSSTKYYQEIINECGYFKTYLKSN